MLTVGNARQSSIPAAWDMPFSRQIAQKAAQHHQPYLLRRAALETTKLARYKSCDSAEMKLMPEKSSGWKTG
jgi:hypothetical protein